MNYSHFADYYGNNKTNKACVDGYHLSSILEEIKFVLEIKSDNTLDVYVSEEDKDYLYSEFTKEQIEKWCNDIKNDAPTEGMDFLQFDHPERINTGDELYLYDTNNVNLNDTKQKAIWVNNGLNFNEVMLKVSKLVDEKDKRNKEETKQEEDLKESVVGKYKTNRKFISFLSALQGAKVRLLRESAYIDGKQLSGVLEGAKFKITICDEDTINFEVVENNSLTPNIDDSMIKRLISSIDEMRVNGYAQKFIVSDLEFKDEDGSRCYLEVEHQKPIDKFASILDSLKEEKSANTTLSDKGFSILDALFTSESDEEVEREFEGDSEQSVSDNIENIQEPNDNLENAVSYMEEQFLKMNEGKINELKKRIEGTEKEVERIRGEISMSEKKLKNQIEDLKVLETRLDSFNKNDDLNGYVFYVSEEQKAEDIGLTEENRAIADKIADMLSLKKDVLFNMLTEGHYKIRIAEKSDMAAEKVKVTSEILEKIKSLVNGDESLEAKVTMVEPGHFEYRGGLSWHQLVGKMIRKGFEQEPEFDKLCQSNSYDSHEEKDEIENN